MAKTTKTATVAGSNPYAIAGKPAAARCNVGATGSVAIVTCKTHNGIVLPVPGYHDGNAATQACLRPDGNLYRCALAGLQVHEGGKVQTGGGCGSMAWYVNQILLLQPERIFAGSELNKLLQAVGFSNGHPGHYRRLQKDGIVRVVPTAAGKGYKLSEATRKHLAQFTKGTTMANVTLPPMPEQPAKATKAAQTAKATKAS